MWEHPGEAALTVVPFGVIAKKTYNGEEITTSEIVLEGALTSIPIFGASLKTVGKKVAGNFVKNLERGVKTSKISKSATVEALDLAETGKKLIHKNSLEYTGPTHVYKITNPKGTYKIGESVQGVNKYGQSKRAEAQARKLQRETGEDYESKILAVLPGKREARRVETDLIKTLRDEGGADALLGNKGLH